MRSVEELTERGVKLTVEYITFLDSLETIAVGNNLRLCMSRAAIGCGWSLYFRDDKSNNNSRAIQFVPRHNELCDLEYRLQLLADEFNAKLGYGKEETND